MKYIKHIFFDLDHTLWDFDKNAALAFEIILKEYNISIPVDQFTKIYNPINQKLWKLYQVNEITHLELRYARLKETFDALEYEVSDELIHAISDKFIDNLILNNFLIEGTIEILDYLKSKYQLHIITNGFAEVQDLKMKNSGLITYFQTITNSELAGYKKPHQNIFEFALSAAKATKEDSIMIGDSYEADVVGALEFGMKAIYFNENNFLVENDIIQIQKLTELKNIL
ncbi:YjjG family noncanonical pyrimidine nucleotidase [Flavobacterium urocaniciphilum]|uniref:Putative hydrolase of the HAD superfamily n=1 Tax=Flavobacterium urocaniciphilum TaxID=1299341 RepID=A0A1H9C722_9FLAO|nr:YjjG family noncanonical pyrimidine nucleotidase [Flavobacterium urocaniciphilum]SEP96747.1 putative hydrolase of the HAD superfamily [Flavobacterium urocaniciphilum]